MLTVENIKDIKYLDKVAREEYLTMGGEPPGVWFNGEAIGRKTGETIKKGELPRVLSGQDADGNKLLTRKTGKKHRPGLDAVFAAPKSVSIAWALADEETRKLISKLGQESVMETLQFLSDKGAALARRGKSGTEKARLENVKLIAGVYEHSSTRSVDDNVDVHLHWHADIANMAQRADGTWGTMELAGFKDWQKAGGAIFRSQFARKLAEYNFKIEPDIEKNGWGFRLAGIPEEIEKEFSGRHEQILEEAGIFSSVEARELAQKKTRAKKEENTLRSDNLREWKERAESYGFSYTPEISKEGGGIRTIEEITPQHFEALVDKEATFTRVKLYTAVANFTVGSFALDKIEEIIKKFDKGKAYFTLTRDIKRRNTEIMTTTEFRSIEKKLLQHAEEMQTSNTHILPKREEGKIILVDGKPLTEEQHKVYNFCTATPGSLKLVVGWAGTGKSFTMKSIKEAYEANGFKVIGAAFAGKAAEELEKGSGISSRTIDSRLLEDKGGRLGLTPKTVLVIDEAGMAGTRHIEAVLKLAKEAGSKVILLGDNKQVKPISAGNPFELLLEKYGGIELEQVFRQKEPWLNTAIKAIGRNHFTQINADKTETHHKYKSGVNTGLEAFDKNGLLKRAKTDKEAFEKLVDSYISSDKENPKKQKLMLAYERKDVKLLNEMLRKYRKETGALTGEDISIKLLIPKNIKTMDTLGQRRSITEKNGDNEYIEETRSFCIGDTIIFLENAHGSGRGVISDANGGPDAKGVKNGMLGKIKGIDGQLFTIDVGDREVKIDTNIYQKLDYGYAVTVHKSQGTTVDEGYMLLTTNYDRNLLYVGVSRAKEKTVVSYSKDAAISLIKNICNKTGLKWNDIKQGLTEKDIDKTVFDKVEKTVKKINTDTLRPIKLIKEEKKKTIAI